jgi:hypothetical protein
VRAQVEPATIALVADGSASAEVAVSFYDNDGQLVRDLPLRVSCTDGVVEVVGAEKGRFRVRYHAPADAPPSGVTDIALALGSFEAHARVELTQPSRRWRVAAHLGWLTNAGLISSPYAAAAASWRAPWFDERLAATVRLGYYGMRDTVEDIAVTGHFVPLTLLALIDVLRDPLRIYAGLGGGIVVTTVGPSYDIDVEIFPMGTATIGAAYPLGPGEIDLAIAGELGLADQRGLSGRLSGFLVTAGYRYTLPW